MTAENAFHGTTEPPQTDTRLCARPGCGERFTPARAHGRYHSDACRAAAWKMRQEDPEAKEARASELIAEANRLRAGRWERDGSGRFAGRRK